MTIWKDGWKKEKYWNSTVSEKTDYYRCDVAVECCDACSALL
jgi:hypothetical protein